MLTSGLAEKTLGPPRFRERLCLGGIVGSRGEYLVSSSGLLASFPTTYTYAHIHTHTHKKINTQAFFKKKKKMVKIKQPSSHFKLGSRGQVSVALINSQSIQHLGIFEKKDHHPVLGVCFSLHGQLTEPNTYPLLSMVAAVSAPLGSDMTHHKLFCFLHLPRLPDLPPCGCRSQCTF